MAWTAARVREWQRTGVRPAGRGLAGSADRLVPELDPGDRLTRPTPTCRMR